MKYRVLKISDDYYLPQYKAWWTFGWISFKSSGDINTPSFFTEENAVNFCKEAMKARRPSEVVWESEPEYHTGFGPE
jgi:hypothetical protein